MGLFACDGLGIAADRCQLLGVQGHVPPDTCIVGQCLWKASDHAV